MLMMSPTLGHVPGMPLAAALLVGRLRQVSPRAEQVARPANNVSSNS